ncbi:MAG: hypothetical protein ACSHX9_17635 [Luteolibacter sp.]
MPDGRELLDFCCRNTRNAGDKEKGSMSFLIMVIVTFMFFPMGFTMLMKTLRAFRPFEFMPFAGTEGENKQNREQGKTFHHVPLS